MATGRFDGKVAVITGGASGIGFAAASRIVNDGGRVVLGDIDADRLAQATGELGGPTVAVGVRTDVTVEAEVGALVAAALSSFGRLDVGVNSAGVGGFSPIVDHAEAEWDRVVAICLKGVFLATKHEAATMRAQGDGGAIVNVASLNAFQAAEGMAAYCAAKAGVVMLTRCAAMELGRHRIRVTGVAPGLVNTPLTAFTLDLPALADAYVDNTPMGRAGEPGDIASAICWLASDEASWVSGDTLSIDGAANTRQYPRMFDILGLSGDHGGDA